MVFIDVTVRQDDDVDAIAVRTVYLQEQALNRLGQGSPEYMGKKYLNEFLMTLNETFINGYERVRDDLEWFICKNDYRYKEQPWKNARDALQRGLVKAGSIMEAEEKKE